MRQWYRMTEPEFVDWIDDQGGVLEALDAGLRSSDLDNKDTMLAFHWHHAWALYQELQPVLQAIDELIERQAAP